MSIGNDLLASLLTPYAIPSALALIIKLALVWRSRHCLLKINPWLLRLLAALFALNLSELLAFAYVSHPAAGLWALKAYYISGICSAVALLGLAFDYHRLRDFYYAAILLFLLGVGVLQIMLPDAALEGVTTIGYSITRIAGPTYWLVKICLLTTLITAMGIMISASLRSPSKHQQKRAFAMLISATPVVAIIVATIIAMHFGVEINATVSAPLAISFLIVVLVYIDNEQGLFNFLAHVPNTEEYRYLRAIRRFWGQEMSLEEARVLIGGIKSRRKSSTKSDSVN